MDGEEDSPPAAFPVRTTGNAAGSRTRRYNSFFFMAMAMQTAAPPQVTLKPITIIIRADVVMISLLEFSGRWPG